MNALVGIRYRHLGGSGFEASKRFMLLLNAIGLAVVKLQGQKGNKNYINLCHYRCT